MIDIDQLYRTVNERLAKKGKQGYATNDDFNDDVRRAQSMLQNFYIKRYDTSSIIEESLAPFIVKSALPITSGIVTRPTDFRHKIAASYQYTVNNADCTDSSYKSFPIIELPANEWDSTMSSVIRGASISKKRGYFGSINNNLRVSFQTGDLLLTYIKVPPTATRAVTLDTVNKVENYNAGASVHLVWNQADDENDLIDIMLYFKGLQTRETELLNWIQANKQMQ